MTEGREVELKLELSSADAERFATLPALGSAKPKIARQASLYFDTPRGDLRQAGFSLRVRSAGGRFVQTLKLQRRAASTLFDRLEWEKRVGGPAPDLAALEKTPLAGLLASKKVRDRLAERFEVRAERSLWTVSSGESRIEVVLDRGEVVHGTRKEPFCEVELELKRGDPASLFALAERLGAEVALRLGVRTKAERGYALAAKPAKARATKAEPLALDTDMAVGEAFAAIVHACLRHFRLNEPWVEAERDAGALHQCRVAMRRLRSAFSLFAPAVRDPDFESIRDGLRWFTGQLGEARNLDVFATRLRRRGRKTSKAEMALRSALAKARDAAYDRVVEALASARLRALMLELVAWVETGPWRSAPPATRPIGTFAEKQLARRWKRVRKAGEQLAALEPEPLHRLRIDVKKLRYAAEFFSGLARSDAAADDRRQLIAALAELQDELGAINDIETGRELIARLSLEGRAEQRLAERLTGRDGDREKHINAAEPVFARLAALQGKRP